MNRFLLQLAFFVSALFLFAPRAYAINESALNFTLNQQTFSVDQQTVSSWQGPDSYEQPNILATSPEDLKASLLMSVGQTPKTTSATRIYNFRFAPIYGYIKTLSEKIDTQKIEPSLNIQNGKVTDLVLPQDGKATDVYQSTINTLDALQIGNGSVGLTVYQTSPEKKLGDTNDLGINELIAEGVSNFKGSPKNRRFNIQVGTEKFKGIIVPKGTEFSFDDILGPVEADSGFLPELVIKKEGTVPEFGGGLCQVSSTTFRAAMAAGLPITARRNHAYAVQYYAPQGTDATIYPGSADLKFINDTPGAILIWPYEKDANTLVFDFYGTKDTRQVTLEKPVVYDKLPDGSMKATWTREVVSADGKTRTDVFKSNYQSPALFHHVETFVSATGAPASNLPVKTIQ